MELEQKVPEKFLALWKKCLPIFEECRPGDIEHALAGIDFIVNYYGDLKLDLDILVPVAMMHDIGHAAILPEHFNYITGAKRIKNAKLVHMLTGAKIALAVLTSIGYDAKKTAEIVDIISMHDADQLEGLSWKESYDTENKKVFHDIDSMDRYYEKRLRKFASNPDELKKGLDLLEKMLDNFFYPEFKSVASANMEKIKAVLSL